MNKSLIADKNAIRKRLIARRNKLSFDEVKDLSELIFKRVIVLKEISNAHAISSYFPVNNEVETSLIIGRLLREGKKIVVPAFVNGEYELSALEKTDSDFEVGPFSILQPVQIEHFSPDDVDVSIIPGVAFDDKGIRLGYGKGVFDKLFGNTKTLKIGLAYDFQVLKKLPAESHDLKMHLVITEKRIIAQGVPK